MKTKFFFPISLVLVLIAVHPSMAQQIPCPDKNGKTLKTDTPSDTAPKTLQLTKVQNGQIIRIDRAETEIQFNRKVEEIDRLFHTPANLPTPRTAGSELGCATTRPDNASIQ